MMTFALKICHNIQLIIKAMQGQSNVPLPADLNAHAHPSVSLNDQLNYIDSLNIHTFDQSDINQFQVNLASLEPSKFKAILERCLQCRRNQLKLNPFYINKSKKGSLNKTNTDSNPKGCNLSEKSKSCFERFSDFTLTNFAQKSFSHCSNFFSRLVQNMPTSFKLLNSLYRREDRYKKELLTQSSKVQEQQQCFVQTSEQAPRALNSVSADVAARIKSE